MKVAIIETDTRSCPNIDNESGFYSMTAKKSKTVVLYYMYVFCYEGSP